VIERALGPLRPLSAFAADAGRVVAAARRGGAAHPRLAAAFDSSLWALALMRGAAALRAGVGSSLGLSAALRLAFHIDVWTDDIGPGLRLPHPFGIVIGEGVTIGSDCTLLHNVTLQNGATAVGDGAVLANGVTILAGADVGAGALIGSHSVVRGAIPARTVAVGAPARSVRPVRVGESS
jgi:serine acetyltransferase